MEAMYLLEKVYCKQRSKRSLAFIYLTSPSIRKRSLKATVHLGTYTAKPYVKYEEIQHLVINSIYTVDGLRIWTGLDMESVYCVDRVYDRVIWCCIFPYFTDGFGVVNNYALNLHKLYICMYFTSRIASFDQYRMRKIRSAIPSISGYLEEIRRNTSNAELGIVVNRKVNIM